jgi:hypothetical protein
MSKSQLRKSKRKNKKKKEKEIQEVLVDSSSVCLVAQDNSSYEVSSQNSSSNEISYEDLVEGFGDLMVSFKSLKSRHKNLKKEHAYQSSKFDLISKERDLALEKLSKAKNDFSVFKNKHVCDSSFDEEMKVLKNRVDCLSTTLSDCASHTLKLESLCCKKNGFKNNFAKPQPAHKQHKRIYHCKCCGRDEHLAMFCYDNVASVRTKGRDPRTFAHKNHWAPKTQRFAPHVWDTLF